MSLLSSSNLPANWIVGQSKKFPDRPYYFNTITKMSTWVHPSSDPTITEEVHVNVTREPRRNCEAAEGGHVNPSSPQETLSEERMQLRGKRTIQVADEGKINGINENSSGDTPQMKALRERIKERMAKGNATKKSKSKLSNSPSKVLLSGAKSTNKVLTNDQTVLNNSKSETKKPEAKELNGNDEKCTMTPQMRILKVRANARKSLSPAVVKKLEMVDKKASEDEAEVGRKNLRSKSLGVPSLESSDQLNLVNRKILTPKSRRESIEQNLKLIKTEEAPPGVSAKRIKVDVRVESKPAQSTTTEVNYSPKEVNVSSKKVNTRKRTIDRTNSTDSKRRFVEVAEPIIYKTAEERMKKLRQRLSNEYYGSNNKLSTISSNSDETDGAKSVKAASLTSTSSRRSLSEDLMEWEPIENDQIISEVNAVRSLLMEDSGDIEIDEIPTLSLTDIDTVDSNSNSSSNIRLYIVIDTNVFLTNLKVVENIRDAKFRNYGRPILVIPWTVLRELDHIKDDRMKTRLEVLKVKSRQAVNFLNSHFKAKHPRIVGQTPKDVAINRQRFKAECADDEILQTCLQIRDSGNSIILLSYDKNLCTKAMVHDIITLNRTDPIEKINYINLNKNNDDDSLLSTRLKMTGNNPEMSETPLYIEMRISEDLYEEIKTFITSFLTFIVAKEMQNIFGVNWDRFTIIQPPWTDATKVLKCAIKHWIAAVSEAFSLRKGEMIMKELLKLLSNLELNRKLKDIGDLINKCFDLIQCLKTDKYIELLTTSTESINDLKQRYLDAVKQIQEEEFRLQYGSERSEEEKEKCAARAFDCFEQIYAIARDFGGTAATLIKMPCTFPFFEIDINNIKNLQPEIAANVNRLLQILSSTLEDIESLNFSHELIVKLHHALSTFLPEDIPQTFHDFSSLDVYYCVKLNEKSLRIGLKQLQELSTHYCQLATFKST